MASWMRPTLSVLVRAMGVSMVPNSCICTSPSVLPKPLSTKAAATGLRKKEFSGPGRITLTPVLWRSSSSVAWPTSTPGTSLILFSGPVGYSPITMP